MNVVLLFLLFSSVQSEKKDWENELVVTRDRCTTIAIGKLATSDGSTIATDTNDCHDCDWRFAKVPAMDWPEGSLRPIYTESSSYPRFIREDRGETWKESNLEDAPQKQGSCSRCCLCSCCCCCRLLLLFFSCLLSKLIKISCYFCCSLA